jgi:predicted AAA+ superfamily ATPase
MEETISKTEKTFKAILITGPRQVGKSTVLKHMFEDKKIYYI